jgi:hypothetical protein
VQNDPQEKRNQCDIRRAEALVGSSGSSIFSESKHRFRGARSALAATSGAAKIAIYTEHHVAIRDRQQFREGECGATRLDPIELERSKRNCGARSFTTFSAEWLSAEPWVATTGAAMAVESSEDTVA